MPLGDGLTRNKKRGVYISVQQGPSTYSDIMAIVTRAGAILSIAPSYKMVLLGTQSKNKPLNIFEYD